MKEMLDASKEQQGRRCKIPHWSMHAAKQPQYQDDDQHQSENAT